MHPWLPTSEQDEADAPPWAEEIKEQYIREKQPGVDGQPDIPGATICNEVSLGIRPPLLIKQHPIRVPKKPMYLISDDLHKELCDKYGMFPGDEYLARPLIARDLRNKLGKIGEAAYRAGMHTFVEARNSYKVWYVPRLWLEEGMEKKLAAEKKTAKKAKSKSKADADVDVDVDA